MGRSANIRAERPRTALRVDTRPRVADFAARYCAADWIPRTDDLALERAGPSGSHARRPGWRCGGAYGTPGCAERPPARLLQESTRAPWQGPCRCRGSGPGNPDRHPHPSAYLRWLATSHTLAVGDRPLSALGFYAPNQGIDDRPADRSGRRRIDRR